MRIRVKDVLEMLAEGVTPEEIPADFPDLQADDIRASIACAAHGVDQQSPSDLTLCSNGGILVCGLMMGPK